MKKLRFKKKDKQGIPLKELIAVHRQFCAPNSLAENLGDGYLYEWNPIFRSIREAVLARGFQFSLKDNDPYYAFPLMSLDEVIDQKKIPFRANFGWLEILEKRAPGKFTLTELKRSELQFNYLYHESAHCIAHAVLFGSVKLGKITPNATALWQILLGEAFANTTEALSSIFVEGELGSYFLDANCHFRANEKEVRELWRSIRSYGLDAVIRVLLVTFLYANFMYEEIGKPQEMRMRKFAKLEKAAGVQGLLRLGFSLCEQFRGTTTQLHLVKLGFDYDLEKYMTVDPLARLMQAPDLQKKVNELVGILNVPLG